MVTVVIERVHCRNLKLLNKIPLVIETTNSWVNKSRESPKPKIKIDKLNKVKLSKLSLLIGLTQYIIMWCSASCHILFEFMILHLRSELPVLIFF